LIILMQCKRLYIVFYIISGLRVILNGQTGVIKPLTITDIFGGWTCFEIYCDYGNSKFPYLKGTKSTAFVQEHWYITSDSIFQFEYPCRIGNRNAYKIQSDSIFYDGLKKGYYHITLKKDSMILTSWGGPSSPAYTKKLIRTNLNIKIIEKLKRELINLDCYIGKMKIQKYIVDEKGFKNKIELPFKMPEYINIPDVKTASEIENKKDIILIIDGQKREFGISTASWYVNKKDPKIKNRLIWKQKTSFIVYPRNWWKGESFEVIYEQL
jgi:hypothetical protein